jgi:exosortase family protein XrtF
VQIKTYYDKIPPLLRSFLFRAIVIFVVWQLAYNFVLAPTRIPDKYLTNVTAFTTEKLLSLFYKDVGVFYPTDIKKKAATILIDGHRIISIADPCNGLDIYVLYISFLFCFPGEGKRRLKFIVLGCAYIFVLNTIRCCLILWLNINHRGWVEISHHYVFTTALYLLVFHVWVLYSKKALGNEAK